MLKLLLAISAVAAIEVAAPAEYSRVWEPLTDAQRVAVRCLEPEVCYSGRRFGAKSNTGCMKGYLYASAYPGAAVLLAREERASMNATTLKTLRDEIVPQAQWVAGWHETKSDLVLRNRSVIHVRGLDDPARVLGLRVGLAVIDQAEQVSLEQFEIANSCVMQTGLPFHQTLSLFNPAGPDHWGFLRYRPDDGDGVRLDTKGNVFARVIHVQHDDLLHLLSQASRERFDRMDGVLGQRLRHGKWVSAEGAVFDNWDTATHVVDRLKGPAVLPNWPEDQVAVYLDEFAQVARWGGYPPPDWKRRRGIDFGYEPDPYCCLWVAESPRGTRHVYRYDLHTRFTIEEQAERINCEETRELEALRASACAQGEDVVRNYGDWLDLYPIAGSYSDHARGEREMLAVRGISTQPAEKDIRAGIETLRELLDHRFGPPRLVIWNDALVERDERLVEQRRPSSGPEEMPRYRWRTVREKGDAHTIKDLPLDRHNHFIDALRYCEHTNSISGAVGIYAG